MNCPQCGGEMWDNTVNKKNPKGPDYKCKDKACAHAIWLDKKTAKGSAPAKSAGPRWTWGTLSQTYWRSLLIAKKHVVAAFKDAAPQDVIAATATLFIAASRDGVSEPKTEPPATTQEPLNQRPAALDDDDDSSLPF